MDTVWERRTRFVHEAFSLLCEIRGSIHDTMRWGEMGKQFRRCLAEAVEQSEGITPEESHRRWCEARRREGWKYGKEYSASRKEHPDLVDYDALPEEEREKDEIFLDLCGVARRWIR